MFFSVEIMWARGTAAPSTASLAVGGAGRAGAVTEWAVGGALLGLTAAVVQLLGRGLAARNARVTRRMQRRRGLATRAAVKYSNPAPHISSRPNSPRYCK